MSPLLHLWFLVMTRLLYWISIFALQVLLFNHLDLTAFLVPQIFIILLITLPLHTKKIYQVLIAFGLGLLADFFVSSPGIHTSSCLFLVMLRMTILNTQDLKEEIANRLNYTARNVGVLPFSYTVLILVFFYHLYIFWIGSIGAINTYNLLVTTLTSSVFSLTVIAILQFMSLSHSRE